MPKDLGYGALKLHNLHPDPLEYTKNTEQQRLEARHVQDTLENSTRSAIVRRLHQTAIFFHTYRHISEKHTDRETGGLELLTMPETSAGGARRTTKQGETEDIYFGVSIPSIPRACQ